MLLRFFKFRFHYIGLISKREHFMECIISLYHIAVYGNPTSAMQKYIRPLRSSEITPILIPPL